MPAYWNVAHAARVQLFPLRKTDGGLRFANPPYDLRFFSCGPSPHCASRHAGYDCCESKKRMRSGVRELTLFDSQNRVSDGGVGLRKRRHAIRKPTLDQSDAAGRRKFLNSRSATN